MTNLGFEYLNCIFEDLCRAFAIGNSLHRHRMFSLVEELTIYKNIY